MVQKRSVGLVVFTEVPELGLVAVLTRRGEWNTEKMAPESYSGACQVTVHGKVEGGESLEGARNRETAEEVGAPARNYILDLAWGTPPRAEFKELERLDTPEKLIVTWGIKLPCDFLKLIRLGPDSGGLRLLRKEELENVKDLGSYSKERGVILRTVVAMFPDEKAAVEKGFDTFA